MITLLKSPRARNRYALSAATRRHAVEHAVREKELTARFSSLIQDEISPVLNSPWHAAAASLLFVSSDAATARFLDDFLRAKSLVKESTTQDIDLDEIDSAILSATLSWRVALHSAQIKGKRGVGPDGSLLSLDQRDSLKKAKTFSSIEAALGVLRDIGYVVNLFTI